MFLQYESSFDCFFCVSRPFLTSFKLRSFFSLLSITSFKDSRSVDFEPSLDVKFDDDDVESETVDDASVTSSLGFVTLLSKKRSSDSSSFVASPREFQRKKLALLQPSLPVVPDATLVGSSSLFRLLLRFNFEVYFGVSFPYNSGFSIFSSECFLTSLTFSFTELLAACLSFVRTELRCEPDASPVQLAGHAASGRVTLEREESLERVVRVVQTRWLACVNEVVVSSVSFFRFLSTSCLSIESRIWFWLCSSLSQESHLRSDLLLTAGGPGAGKSHFIDEFLDARLPAAPSTPFHADFVTAHASAIRIAVSLNDKMGLDHDQPFDSSTNFKAVTMISVRALFSYKFSGFLVSV